MLSLFLPRSEPCLAHLAEMAGRVQMGGELFQEMFVDFKNRERYSERIKEIEVECDRIADRILENLNTTFITSIDRKDIRMLVAKLDEVIDFINGLALKMELYGVKKIRPEAARLSAILARCTAEVAGVFVLFKKKQDIAGHARIVDRLEKEADQIYQNALRQLFKKEKDPIEVVRWNAIFEGLEDSVDRCNDLTGTLTSIVVKNR